MMENATTLYLVSGNYCSLAGNPCGFRFEIKAHNSAQAFAIAEVRIHKRKNYFGRLDMACDPIAKAKGE